MAESGVPVLADAGAVSLGKKNVGGRPRRERRVEVEGEGFLRAMRFVLANKAEFDRTVEEHAMRKLLSSKPLEFMDKMNELEGGGSSGGEDLGSDRAEALIAKLLKAGVGDVG